jgi:hypothetical protein
MYVRSVSLASFPDAISGPCAAALYVLYKRRSGRDSSVGIVTGYGLGGTGIESRLGARFSAPVQTGPGAHPAYCKMGSGSFHGIKRPGRGVDHPLPSRAGVKERAQLYFYSTSGPSWPVIERSLPFYEQI